MSLLPSNDAPALSGKSIDDIFKSLSEGDNQETLDLTKPLKEKKPEKEEKIKADDQDRKDDSAEDDEEKPEDEEDDEEVDELKDIEEELEEPDDEKLELTTPVRRREILKKYPNLFKDFPYLEKAYYREQQFTEIVATIDDAKAAVAAKETLDKYVDDMVVKGNVNNVLKLIKDTSPETFAGVVDNYMDHLANVDREAYGHVLGNITRNIILGMVEEAQENEDLKVAALLLNKYAFGTSKFTPPKKLAKSDNPESKEKESGLAKREQEFAQRATQAAMNEVDTRINNSIKSAIENNIDPNGVMTDYNKRNAIRDAQEKISELITKDVRFKKIVDKLWEKAAKTDFSEASKAEIRKAFLAKAKSLLAPVLKSARNEALKGMGRKVKEDKEDVEDNDMGDKPQRQRTERRLSSDREKTKLDLKGKSSLEALQEMMGD
jgi:hypothetical protein